MVEDRRPTVVTPTPEVRLAEWKVARGIVTKMDGTVSGLRKYGFSFITALLAADSLLGQATLQAPYSISDPVKFAVFVTTLVLICALYSTDRFYRIIQSGAAHAAKIVETRLGIQLTEVISKYYDHRGARYYVETIYGLFVGATAILGVLVLQPSQLVVGIAIGSTLAVGFIIAMETWADTAESQQKEVRAIA